MVQFSLALKRTMYDFKNSFLPNFLLVHRAKYIFFQRHVLPIPFQSQNSRCAPSISWVPKKLSSSSKESKNPYQRQCMYLRIQEAETEVQRVLLSLIWRALGWGKALNPVLRKVGKSFLYWLSYLTLTLQSNSESCENELWIFGSFQNAIYGLFFMIYAPKILGQ